MKKVGKEDNTEVINKSLPTFKASLQPPFNPSNQAHEVLHP
jgi:hypothetical protein